MATVINKDKIQGDATLYPGQVLLANNLPVVTTDEVAVELNTSFDSFGNETVTSFNTLTDKLAYIDQSIAQIPSLSINNTSSTEFTVCGGNDSGSDPHTVSLINTITLNGSTLNVKTTTLNFKTLHDTLASILSRLSDLENGSSGPTPKPSSMANPGSKSVTYGGSATVTISCTNCSVASASSSNTSSVTVTRSGNTLTLTAVGNAGTSATITVTGTGNTNYNNPSNITFIATIAKKTSVVTAPTGRTVNYNGSAQALANAGSCTGGKIQYSLASGGTYNDSIPTAINYTSGTTVYWKAVLSDTTNYALPSSGTSGSVTGIINKIASSMANPGAKSVTYNTTQTIPLTYTGLSTISVSSSNSNIIAASISNSTLSLKAKKGTGSATISISGTPSNNYLAPDVVNFTATADKAQNTISISPTATSINVVNGLYNGNSYYIINNVTTTAGTGVNATSSNVDKLYFNVGSSSYLQSYYFSDNNHIITHFGTKSDGVETVTLSNTGNDNYHTAQNKVITFNFSNSTPSTNYYWYLGSSDSAVNNGDNPTALNTNYSGWHNVTSMPVWNNLLGSAIGVDASRDDYTWVIMPTVWFNNLIVKTVSGAPISWQYTWTINNNGTQYTAVWADVTARLLYFTLK